MTARQQGENTMSVHDWTRVDAGMFHDFHLSWLAEMKKVLNGGLLPSGYYALAEQHAGPTIPDVVTLHLSPSENGDPVPLGSGVATVTKTRPRVQRRLEGHTSPKGKRRTLIIRHVSGHRIIALVEIVSPANKDRKRHVIEFTNKAVTVLQMGIHLLLIDLLPPGKHDPCGMHGVVWERFDPDVPPHLPPGKPLSLAAYAVSKCPEAFLDHLAVGDALPAMPLFLTPRRYVDVPLESTYMAAFAAVPEYWRNVIEGKERHVT